jgi:nucleotide-binding universal stress UspA family protein
MFKSIIWATDGSAAADRAMPFVKSLASESPGAEVTVFHVDQLLVGRAGGQHVLADEDQIRAKVERQTRELKDAGVNASERMVHVTTGDGPAQLIAETAKQLESDLIVVGTRGHTALGGLLLGSTTNRLLHIAPCPVFVVPTSKDAESTDSQPAAAEAVS